MEQTACVMITEPRFLIFFVGLTISICQKTKELLLSLLRVNKDQTFLLLFEKAIAYNSEDFLGFLFPFVFCGSFDSNLFLFLLLSIFYSGFYTQTCVIEHLTFN